MVEIQSIVRELTQSPTAGGVLATLVSVEGSSYRRPGARLLLTPDGRRIGSISGGCLEEDLLARARNVAETGRAELVTYDTTAENDVVWGVGLGCHGVVKVLIERLPAVPCWAPLLAANFLAHERTPLDVVWQAPDPHLIGTTSHWDRLAWPDNVAVFHDTVPPPTRLVIFGAGDDARPLVHLAKELGWHVTVGDPRAAFATTARFPTTDALVVAPAAALVDRIDPPWDALAVVMTHHYVHDVPILRDLFSRNLPYVGLLGPKKRARQIIDDLRASGVSLSDRQLAQFHAPVGLDLGAETPEEVALSIMAEMRAKLATRDGRPLRERTRPIHD